MLFSHAVNTPLIYLDEYIEQSPKVLTDALTEITRTIAQAYTVDAISLTAFRSAPTLVDKTGKALTNFIMWQDKRNKSICEALATHNSDIHARSGACVNTVFTAGKIAWLKKNHQDIYLSSHKAMVVPDYIIHFMTGEFFTDVTYGSRTLLMDIKTLTWDPELCKHFDVDLDKLCDLIPQGSVAGYTTAAFSAVSGVKEGIPVISAGGDQQCSALGLGVTDVSRLAINNGTGSFILSLTDEPVLSNRAVICNVAAVPGKYTLESNVITSASALDWVMDAFFRDLRTGDGKPDYDAFNALAKSAPAGANGLVCLPLFEGCGTRHWNPQVRASFIGMSLSTSHADIARSLYEGICAEIIRSIAFMPLDRSKLTSTSLAGGLSQSDVFNQILCDMLGLPLTRYGNSQATAIGAFASAAVALGIYLTYETAVAAARQKDEVTMYQPDSALSAVYHDYLDRSGRLFKALYPV